MKPRALWMLLAFIPAMRRIDDHVQRRRGLHPCFRSVKRLRGSRRLHPQLHWRHPVTPPTPIPEIDVDAFINVPVLNTGGWILTDGVNMIPGIMVASNLIEFLGVPFNPPGTGNLAFQVENILVNPSAEPPGFQFKEELEITSNFSIERNEPCATGGCERRPRTSIHAGCRRVGSDHFVLRRKRSLAWNMPRPKFVRSGVLVFHQGDLVRRPFEKLELPYQDRSSQRQRPLRGRQSFNPAAAVERAPTRALLNAFP